MPIKIEELKDIKIKPKEILILLGLIFAVFIISFRFFYLIELKREYDTLSKKRMNLFKVERENRIENKKVKKLQEDRELFYNEKVKAFKEGSFKSVYDGSVYILALCQRYNLTIESVGGSQIEDEGTQTKVYTPIRISGSENDILGFLYVLEKDRNITNLEEIIISGRGDNVEGELKVSYYLVEDGKGSIANSDERIKGLSLEIYRGNIFGTLKKKGKHQDIYKVRSDEYKFVYLKGNGRERVMIIYSEGNQVIRRVLNVGENVEIKGKVYKIEVFGNKVSLKEE